MTVLDVRPGAGDGALVLESTRDGQLRVALPDVPRGLYPTGLQVPCARHAERGVPKKGMPRYADDPTPLCIPCWQREDRRRARAAQAELSRLVWEAVGEVDAAEAAEACESCGRGGRGVLGLLAAELVPAAAVPAWRQARRRARRRGRERVPAALGSARLVPRAEAPCWRCGVGWLEHARAEFVQEQAELAAVEAARAAAAAAVLRAEFERMAAMCGAEREVAELEDWLERLRMVLQDHATDGRKGRAVLLLADALARDAGARTTGRGRPSKFALVAAILAVDSDWRSGRRAMPGRARTAFLAGVCEGAVTAAWKRAVALRWAKRTKKGKRLTLDERVRTGRAKQRAEYDLRPLHRTDPAVWESWVPVAVHVLEELLQHGLALLADAQGRVDVLRARAGGSTSWGEHARRARLRQALAVVKDQVTGRFKGIRMPRNIRAPHTVSRGEYVSSGSSFGLVLPPPSTSNPFVRPGLGRPAGRRRAGASRSSTRATDVDLEGGGRGPRSRPVEQPRTLKRQRRRSPTHPGRLRPSWADDLAYDLVKEWVWLGRSRADVCRVAATVSTRLGPGWTAPMLAGWADARNGRQVLDAPDKPLRYLATLLDRVLAGCVVDGVVPPAPALGYDRARRAAIEEAAEQRRAERAATRAALDERDAAAAVERAGPGTGRAAAIAVAAMAWPAVAAPGAGLPAGWRRGADRHDGA